MRRIGEAGDVGRQREARIGGFERHVVRGQRVFRIVRELAVRSQRHVARHSDVAESNVAVRGALLMSGDDDRIRAVRAGESEARQSDVAEVCQREGTAARIAVEELDAALIDDRDRTGAV